MGLSPLHVWTNLSQHQWRRYVGRIIMMSQQIQGTVFVCNAVCPFAHRVWLALLEAGVQFESKEVDIVKKSPWFTEIYRKAYASDPISDGKVPVLIHEGKVLAESDLIVWFLAQTYPNSNLLPASPFERLKIRHFVQNAPGKLITAFYSSKGLASKTAEEQEQGRAKILQALEAIEKSIEGPYVLGEHFSLADIMLYPWFERWSVLETMFGLTIPATLPKLHTFITAMQSRPSVQSALAKVSPEFYLSIYKPYLT